MSKCSICLEEGIIVNRCVECYKKVLEISEKNGKVEARRDLINEVAKNHQKLSYLDFCEYMRKKIEELSKV